MAEAFEGEGLRSQRACQRSKESAGDEAAAAAAAVGRDWPLPTMMKVLFSYWFYSVIVLVLLRDVVEGGRMMSTKNERSTFFAAERTLGKNEKMRVQVAY